MTWLAWSPFELFEFDHDLVSFVAMVSIHVVVSG